MILATLDCITDTIAQQITPQAMSQHIEAIGWRYKLTVHDAGAIYESPRPSGSQQIMVHLRPDYQDYHLRVSEYIKQVMQIESRPAEHILNQLLHPDADILRFRLSDGVVPSITFPQALETLSNIEKLLHAAALSQLDDVEALNYVERTRLGQTEWDGFAISVICPLGPASAQMRDVTLSLVDALEQLQHGTISEGVSAEICIALERLMPKEGSMAIDVEWSRSLPAGGSAWVQTIMLDAATRAEGPPVADAFGS